MLERNRSLSRRGVIGALAASPFLAGPATAAPADLRGFSDWAKANAVPLPQNKPAQGLAPLGRMIGDARIVTLGEGMHGAIEPMQARNDWFRYLSERHGFTGIALESGVTSAFQADDFVGGAPGNAKDVANKAITFGLGDFPQQADLLDWMRDANNSRRAAAKLRFFGMDVEGELDKPGSPIDITLAYLTVVDAPAASAFAARLLPFRARLKVDRRSPAAVDQYTALTMAERDAVTATIGDLVRHIERNEGAFILASSPSAYRRAAWAAIAARQGDAYLRGFPIGWTAAQPPATEPVATADRVKADNIARILDELGPSGRVMIFTHIGHAAASPVSVRWAGATIPLPPMVGSYLKRWYGPDVVTIGHLVSQDETPCGAARPPAANGTLEAALAEIGPDALLLDLRTAPAGLRAQLQGPYDLYSQIPTHAIDISQSVDIIYFTRTATRALPCLT